MNSYKSEPILIPNFDEFTCSICYLSIKPNEGIALQECLHTFCKECLVKTIEYCPKVEVMCPFINESGSICEKYILDGEIRAILSKDALEKYHNKSLQAAEAVLPNTFHCKTANCQGWCFCDSISVQFHCSVCSKINCVACKAIHEGVSCFDFQKNANYKADEGINRTDEMLKKELDNQMAMNCPKCKNVIFKEFGCDWLECPVCYLEICWATKGARWGPNGNGDTSGGCQCGKYSKKCHPNCSTCH